MDMERSSAIICPAPLAARGFVLRPETPEDQPSLRQLFRMERGMAFALLPLPEEQKHQLLDNQFDFQLKHYRAAYPGFDILVLAHGAAPCGRLCLAREADDMVLVDILIDPARRRQGIGGALIRALQEHASALGLGVRLHVDKTNPAQALYQRLGFTILADKEVSWAMIWRANS